MMPMDRLQSFRSQNPMAAVGSGTSMSTSYPVGANVSANISAGGSATAQLTGILVVALAAIVILSHFGLK